jgi:putative ABC transport system permease protein
MIQRLAAMWRRVRGVIFRRRLEHEVEEELAFHLAMREADYVREGMESGEARAAARRRFGNVTHFKEHTRDMWTFPSLESFWQDARFAMRTLRKAPGFSIVTVAVLAIGIGGNTAIFSLMDAMRGRSLPYDDPDRLVQLWGTVERTTVERRGNSFMDFIDWRARSTSFVDMAAFDGQRVTLADSGQTERIPVEYVSAPYFSLLGIEPAIGRTFSEQEDRVPATAFVAVVSDGFWRRRLGATPSALGQSLTLNQRPYTIIGVMPRGFSGLTDSAELWLPFALDSPAPVMYERGNRWFVAIARLKSEISRAAAQAELDGISHQLEAAYPDTNEKRAVEVSPLETEIFGTFRPALLALMAAVAFVLLIACANVANLLLARSEVRAREIAVRTALGAGRGRLLRQVITESCVLTAIGAIAGLALARLAITALVPRSPITFPSFVSLDLDARAAAFTIAVSIACGVLVGLAPWLQTRSLDLGAALKESARGSAGPRAQRMRSTLVVAEIAMAVLLLVGASLMIRSVAKLAGVDPGFQADSVITLHASLPDASSASSTASAPSVRSPFTVRGRALLERIRAIRGVDDAALGTDLPLDGNSSAGFYSAEGIAVTTTQNWPRTYRHRVTAGFFRTLRIPMVAGRTFTEAEIESAAPVAVVSERLVKRFWPGANPLGKRIKLGTTDRAPWQTIVGVVGEIKYRGLPDNPTADPDVYLPFSDRSSEFGIAVRSSLPPSALVATIRNVIRDADSSIPVFGVSPMPDLLRAQTAQSRFTMWLMGIFAAIALALAVIGIYGVMSYLVTQRRREIGIRLALGAAGPDIVRLVVGSGARLIAVGIVIGLAGAFALERAVASLLFGVTAADIASVAAVAVLASVALIACYVPAARATRVDPLHALRCE